MDNLLSKIKEGNSKKQIENIVIFLVLLIIVIIVINSLFSDTEEVSSESSKIVTETKTIAADELESKLKNILSMIDGVGNSEVMVSYSNTIEQIPMYDTKENTTEVLEEDTNGGTRKTKEVQSEQSIIYEEKNSTKTPAVKQTIMPQVIGVIVVAEGASNAVVKEDIKNAVEAVVDIPSHRIQIFAK